MKNNKLHIGENYYIPSVWSFYAYAYLRLTPVPSKTPVLMFNNTSWKLCFR